MNNADRDLSALTQPQALEAAAKALGLDLSAKILPGVRDNAELLLLHYRTLRESEPGK